MKDVFGPRSDEFEIKGKSQQGQKTAFFYPFGGLRAAYV